MGPDRPSREHPLKPTCNSYVCICMYHRLNRGRQPGKKRRVRSVSPPPFPCRPPFRPPFSGVWPAGWWVLLLSSSPLFPFPLSTVPALAAVTLAPRRNQQSKCPTDSLALLNPPRQRFACSFPPSPNHLSLVLFPLFSPTQARPVETRIAFGAHVRSTDRSLRQLYVLGYCVLTTTGICNTFASVSSARSRSSPPTSLSPPPLITLYFLLRVSCPINSNPTAIIPGPTRLRPPLAVAPSFKDWHPRFCDFGRLSPQALSLAWLCSGSELCVGRFLT